MSITDSSIAPVLFLLAGFSVLAGFFRKTLVRVLIVLAVEVVFFAVFPKFLVKFVNLITAVHNLVR